MKTKPIEILQTEAITSAVNAMTAVLVMRADGEIVFASDKFCDMMKYTREQLVGQNHRLFLPRAERLQKPYADFWAELRKGQPQSAAFKRITGDQKDIWLRANYVPVANENGEVEQIVKIAIDITEEKNLAIMNSQRLQALDKSNARAELDVNGTLLVTNEIFASLFGYQADELQGRHHSILVDEQTKTSRNYGKLWECLAGGDHVAGEFAHVTKQGKTLWLKGGYHPIFDSLGNITKYELFATDVTQERDHSTAQSEQMKAIYRSTAIAEFDTRGNILGANSIFLEMTKYGLNEIIGRHHSIFVGEDEATSKSYQDFWTELRHGNFQHGEFRRYDKYGRDVWIRGAYNPVFDSNGRVTKIMKFAFDVTAVKTADKILHDKNLELEEARHKNELSEALHALVATYNHEINNSLTMAISYLDAANLNSEGAQRLQNSLWKIAETVKKIEDVASRTDREYAQYAAVSKMLKLSR